MWMSVPTCPKCKAAMRMKPYPSIWGNYGGTSPSPAWEWECGVCEGREVICECCGTQVLRSRITSREVLARADAVRKKLRAYR